MREQLLIRSGVYAIRNRSSGKMYVGSTVQFTKRWHDHRRKLDAGVHPCIALQRAWDKYGTDTFEWIILEFCSIEELLGREQYWMDWFGSYRTGQGYNIRCVAHSNHGIKVAPEIVQRRRAKQIGHKRTPEQRERIRAGKIGHEVTAETRAKISATKAQRYAEGWRPSFVPPPRPIDADRVKQVRALLAQGVTLAKIEEITGVSDSTAYRIKVGKPPYGHE